MPEIAQGHLSLPYLSRIQNDVDRTLAPSELTTSLGTRSTFPMDTLLQAVEHDLSHHSSDIATSDEDDPLAADVQMRPLNALTQREEAVRLRMEGHAEMRDDRNLSARAGMKRSHGEYEFGGRVVRRKGDLSRSFQDPVQLGYCSEAQGLLLFES